MWFHSRRNPRNNSCNWIDRLLLNRSYSLKSILHRYRWLRRHWCNMTSIGLEMLSCRFGKRQSIVGSFLWRCLGRIRMHIADIFVGLRWSMWRSFVGIWRWRFGRLLLPGLVGYCLWGQCRCLWKSKSNRGMDKFYTIDSLDKTRVGKYYKELYLRSNQRNLLPDKQNMPLNSIKILLNK